MKLAARMDRILVESAFDVLVRARALEAQGRSVIHLEIGEPDFPTPRTSSTPPSKRWMKAGRTTVRRRDCRNCARRSQRHVSETRGIDVGRNMCR